MTYDLAIIGGGILGSFHAYHAAKAGLRTILFEKSPTPMGASVRNFGQVVPSGFDLNRWHTYGKYSTDLYKYFGKNYGFDVFENGSTYIASTMGEMAVLEEAYQKFMETGYTCQLWSKSQLMKFYPALDMKYPVGALRFPQEVSVIPGNVMVQFQQLLAQSGVDIRLNTTVLDCSIVADYSTVTTAAGEVLKVGKTIICNGSDFEVLFPELFAKAPLELVKLQMLQTLPQPGVSIPGNILTGLSIRRYESFKACKAHANLDPSEVDPAMVENGIHILFKQNPDGSVVIGDSHHYASIDQRHTLDFAENGAVNRLIRNEASRIMQLPRTKVARSWSGYYSQTTSENGIYEVDIENQIYISTGIGGKGMTASAGYAKENIERIFELDTISTPVYEQKTI